MAVNETIRALRRAGLVDPRQLAALSAAALRWGPSLATVYAAGALRHPNRPALIDHRGSLTFRRLDARSTALAKGLRASGLEAGQHLGLLCHNHRDFVEANVAAAKAGLAAVYLNTGFAPPQLAEVIEREQVAGLVVDADLLPTVEASGITVPVFEADGETGGSPTLRATRAAGQRGLALLPSRPAGPVLLTSGTTGTPKGAQRERVSVDMGTATGILQRIPYRAGDVFVIPCPLFHAWGLSQLVLAAALGSTAVLVRRFDPQATVDAVAEHRGTVLAVVPVMLQRMLAADSLDPHDLSSLRVVASSGSALPGHLALAWMDRVGDTLYNLYGSTEVGQATIATPEDMRAAPGTAGRVIPGSIVAILDAAGNDVPTGSEGEIFVGNRAQFSGYTGGGTKEQRRGLMSSGDVGYFDPDGRLFVTGRADDMIVSGGENVFPGEVEDVIAAEPDVVDAAVVGVPDPDFGQRLAAFVVTRPGSDLDADAIRKLVAGRLARHKVPRDVTFVAELPRTTTGKLLRRELG
jgi:fatty-acyl-CoA synthase